MNSSVNSVVLKPFGTPQRFFSDGWSWRHDGLYRLINYPQEGSPILKMNGSNTKPEEYLIIFNIGVTGFEWGVGRLHSARNGALQGLSIDI